MIRFVNTSAPETPVCTRRGVHAGEDLHKKVRTLLKPKDVPRYLKVRIDKRAPD